MTSSSVTQFIPLRISWRGHKSMWPVAFDAAFWLFIYSSKERGVKMPAHMTATVVTPVACVCPCTPHLKPTLLTELPPETSKPAAFQWRDIFHQALGWTTLCIPNVLIPSPQCPHTPRSWATKPFGVSILNVVMACKISTASLNTSQILGTNCGRMSQLNQKGFLMCFVHVGKTWSYVSLRMHRRSLINKSLTISNLENSVQILFREFPRGA